MTVIQQTQILVVDDEPGCIKILSAQLQKYGFTVLVASDGAEALQILQQTLPDLILLDVMMQDMDGFEVCRLLKATEATKDIPIMFMSALSSSIDKIKGLTLGAVDYLTKPLSYEEVIARINVHLKIRSLTKQLEEQNALLRQDVRSRQLVEATQRLSEEKFSRAFRSSPGPMTISTLEDGRFLEVNQSFCTTTGYALEEVLGETSEDLNLWVNSKDRDRFREALEKNGVVNKLEAQFRTKSGEIKIGLVCAEIIYIWDVPCILSMIYDITALKRASAALFEKEQFLRSIYEGVEEAIFVVDVLSNGEFRYAGLNPAHVRLVGLSLAEVQGKTPEQVLSLAEAANVKQHYQTCINIGGKISYEERLLLRGQETYWLTTLTPIRDEHARIYRIIGTSINITDRRQAEENLRRSEERWQLALRGSNDGIWDHDLVTDKQYLSSRCLEILGYTHDQINTFDEWLNFVHPDDVPVLKATFQKHLNRETPYYVCEYRMRCQDGRYKWLLVRGQAIWDQAGFPIRALGSITDITKLVHQRESLRGNFRRRPAIARALR